MFHRGKVAERVRVRQRPVLVEAFLVVSSLDIVEPAGVAPVVPGVNPPLGVDLDAEGVAAPLGEDLIPARLRVIPPDQLSHRVDRLLAGIKARDESRGR